MYFKRILVSVKLYLIQNTSSEINLKFLEIALGSQSHAQRTKNRVAPPRHITATNPHE